MDGIGVRGRLVWDWCVLAEIVLGLIDQLLSISLTFGRMVVTIRSSVGCKYRHARHAKQTGSRVFFLRMAPCEDGERARQLANTLLRTKDAGRHHQERASALTSLRRQIRCCALATTITCFAS